MRGQTTLDFVIGVSIFLAVVLFTFGFVPGILDPFEVSEEENPSIADRTADRLTQDTLGSPAQPYVLDRYCAVEFFDEGEAAPSECNYSGTTFEERIGKQELKQINVTITGESDDPLCWTDSTTATGEPGLDDACGSGDILLTAGDNQPVIGETTITARRVVSLYGQSVTVEVVVW
jgi:hypothetical protein